jgi:mRNA interferase MazF
MKSNAIERGDIYWVNLDPTLGSEIKKQRPCVVVSATPINQARHTVVVVPLSTSAKARAPLVVTVHCLEQQVSAACDQVRAIDKNRMVKYAGQLSVQDLALLENGLRYVLAI